MKTHGNFWRKEGDSAACLKDSVNIFVDWIHEIQSLGGSGTSVLYMEQVVARG